MDGHVRMDFMIFRLLISIYISSLKQKSNYSPFLLTNSGAVSIEANVFRQMSMLKSKVNTALREYSYIEEYVSWCREKTI